MAAVNAGTAATFVATQIAGIVQSAIQGPGKAEGGAITGGSGSRDDVPIMAMGGEYIIQKSSVNKYGASFMDALNKGLVPVNNFNVPSFSGANPSQTHFAEGGAIAGGLRSAPVAIELKNESGTPLKASKAEQSFNGQEYVVSVVIDALDRNVGGLRDILGGT